MRWMGDSALYYDGLRRDDYVTETGVVLLSPVICTVKDSASGAVSVGCLLLCAAMWLMVVCLASSWLLRIGVIVFARFWHISIDLKI
jgi:hypothetical protein